eukprot:scaffold3217_cov221-Alexandrium_tamarense.AAC.15
MDGVVADGRLEGGVVGDITGMGEPVVQRDGIFAGCQWLGGGRRRCWRCCRHIGSRSRGLHSCWWINRTIWEAGERLGRAAAGLVKRCPSAAANPSFVF